MNIQAYIFLIVLNLIFFGEKCFAQVSPKYSSDNQIYQRLLVTDSLPIRPGMLLPVKQDHYAKHLTFFCRQELKFEKATKLPLRLRVGSVEQCDFLEGK